MNFIVALRSRKRPWMLLPAIAFAVLSVPAGAVSLCVSTAQQLQQALTDASTTYSGQDVEINLVQGTYNTGAATANGPFRYQASSLARQILLIGGWTAQCAGLSRNAALTVLNGNHTTQVLSIWNPFAIVTVEHLTIENGETTEAGGGLSINPGGGANTVYIGHNIIRNNHTTNSGGGIFALGGGNQLDLIANVITGNSADSGNGAGAISANNGLQVYVVSNTIYANTTTQQIGAGGLRCCGPAQSEPIIYLNIFRQNTNYGLVLNGPPADVEYNDYGNLDGTVPAHDIGNVNTSAQFVDAANGDLHLSGSSPLLGYAPAYLATSTKDVEGNPYPLTGKVDLGAYAETIFINGFDGN